jgi:hypothetical protein
MGTESPKISRTTQAVLSILSAPQPANVFPVLRDFSGVIKKLFYKNIYVLLH